MLTSQMKAQAVDNFAKVPRSFALFEPLDPGCALPLALPPPALRSRSEERPPPSVPFGSSAPRGKSGSCGLRQPARSHADCHELLEHQDGHQRIIQDLHDSYATYPVNLHGRSWKHTSSGAFPSLTDRLPAGSLTRCHLDMLLHWNFHLRVLIFDLRHVNHLTKAAKALDAKP